MPAENVRNVRVTGPANTRTPLSQTRLTVVSALVVALDSNTDKVAVGGIAADGAVATAAGQNTVLLAAGDSIPFGSVDLADLGLVPRVTGDGVAVLWEE